MIVTCPQCLGRLSTAAPQCPHCGFVPRFSSAGTAPAGVGPPPGPFDAPLEPPSKETVQKATRRTLADWKRSRRKQFLMGAILIIGAVASLVAVFLLANRLNAGRRTQAVSRSFASFVQQRFDTRPWRLD